MLRRSRVDDGALDLFDRNVCHGCILPRSRTVHSSGDVPQFGQSAPATVATTCQMPTIVTRGAAMPTAVIVDAIRTPLGRRNGKLKDWHPVDLAAETLKALIDRTGIDPAIVDDVVMGCVMQVGEQAANIGRNAVLAAGLAGLGARHHDRPPVRVQPAGRPLRRAGRDRRRVRRGRRRRASR